GYDCSHSIIGTIADWQPSDYEEFVIAIGDMEVRKKVAELLTSKGGVFASLIHPTALIGDNSSLDRGLIMYSYSKINVNCTVGEFVSLASFVSIGHDTEVGNFCALSTGCVITGRVKIGHLVFIGPNSTVLPNVSVGNHVFAAGGSVVMTNIKAGMRIMGNPARPFLPNTSK
ncbi:MAG: sugar O-acyltransferase, partial [Bacteroidales bacterium]